MTRDAARERARATRAKEQVRRKRGRTLAVSGIVVGALAASTLVTLVIANSVRPAGPGPRNMASDGILLRGSAGEIRPVETAAVPDGGEPTATEQDDSVADITVYTDYMCPYCNQFETSQMPQIRQMVEDGSATLELHPVTLLDRVSLGSRYSTRSAAAAACVADRDPADFLAFHTALYTNQPSEKTRGLTNDQLVSLAAEAGATGDEVAACITDQRFAGWVADATDRALTKAVPNSSLPRITSTPTVLVDGAQYTGSLTDTTAFASFVQEHGGAA